jgi:hypothetical protein
LHSRKVLANFRPERHEGGEEEEGEGASHSSAAPVHIELVQLLFVLYVAFVSIRN